MNQSNYNLKTIFFGSSKFVIPVIKTLQQNLNLAAVYTTEQKPTDAVPAYCIANNIPYVSLSKFTPEILDGIKNTNVQFATLASFGIILPADILNLFPKGILNIHPSLLPKYRGTTPVQSAILSGDNTTGVTIIKLDDQMDHGPILAQQEEPISKTDTTDSLQLKLFTKGATLLINALPEYISEKTEPQTQNHDHATYTQKMLSRKDGFFEISNPPSKEKLDLMIRAYHTWPGVWTLLNFKENQKIVKLLPENKIQVEGRKPMSIKDFINGYPELKEKLQKIT